MSQNQKLKNTMNQNQQKHQKNRTLKKDRYLNYQPYVQLQHRGKEPFLHTFPPPKGSVGTIPNRRLFWSVLLSPSGSVLLRFLLQWSWLAAPNLNLWLPPPEWARGGDSSRDWVVWFWNRDHFPPLSAELSCPQTRDPQSPPYQAPTSWKGVWVVASLDPLYSLSSECSGGTPGNLKGGRVANRWGEP